MKFTNKLPIISILLVIMLASTVSAFDFIGFAGWDAGAIDGGAFSGFDAGAIDGGSFSGFDAGAIDGGSFSGADAGIVDGGANAGTDAGAIDGGAFAGTDASSIDAGGPGFLGSLGNLFEDFFDFVGGDIPGGDGVFPTNADAIWSELKDKTIKQGSRSGTLIQANILNKCTDPDDDILTFRVMSTSKNFDLKFVKGDLRIYNLNRDFVGVEQVTLGCNNVPASFNLKVVDSDGSTGDNDSRDGKDGLSVHIGTLRIPDDAQPGDLVPVQVNFRNNGHDKLENLKVAIVVQDLAIRASVGPLDLLVGKTESRTMMLELPEDMEKGLYYGRLTIDSASLHRVVHREFMVE
jgi:hypothetical protein